MKAWQLYRALNPALSLADLGRRWRYVADRLRRSLGRWREVWRLAEDRYARTYLQRCVETERDDDDEIRVGGCLVEAVNEVERWRKGGVTEDLLRRHDGSIHLARGCSIVRTEDVAVIRTDEPDSAEVVAFDGEARTITLRFDTMPCAAIGERWRVRPDSRGGGE